MVFNMPIPRSVPSIKASKKAQLIPLAVFMALLGTITVLMPTLGILLFCLCAFITFCWFYPLYSFALVSFLAFLNNINIVYDAPIRVVTERYTIVTLPIIIILTIVVIKIVSNNKRFFVHRPYDSKDGVNRSASPVSSYDYLIILFCLWSAVTMLWTQDIYHGWNSLFSLTLGCILYFLALYFLTDRKSLEVFFKVIFLGGLLLVVLFTLSNKIDFTPYVLKLGKNLTLECGLVTYEQRPGGFAPPQLAANMFVFILFSGYCLWASANKALKYSLIGLSVVFCSAIFASGSKAASGSFLIGVLSLIAIYPPLRKRFVWVTPLTLAALLGTLLFNSLVLGSDRMTQGGDMNSASLSYRLEFWEVGFAQLREYAFGIGIGGFARLVDPWPGAHSLYFGVLFEEGGVGWLILFLYLMLLLTEIISFRNISIDPVHQLYGSCILSYWIVFFIHGTVDIAYFLPHIWLFLGATSAIIKMVKKNCITPSHAF
ncbi:hypothetical protein KKHLCK_05715 [Candidatus Electrothrix laxa]